MADAGLVLAVTGWLGWIGYLVGAWGWIEGRRHARERAVLRACIVELLARLRELPVPVPGQPSDEGHEDGSDQ